MVLSNYKCMHIQIQNSKILQVHSSNVSSNRIKIHAILLILQLETDYSPSYSFQKYIRSSGITVFTETSRTAILHKEVLQDSSAPIPANSTRAHYTTIQRILHPESNSTCRRQRALRVLLLLLLHTEGKETFSPEKKFYA